MIESKLEELFNSIENSPKYKAYKKMEQILDKDKELKELIDEIKVLEKKATYLENIGDEEYILVDEVIKEKAECLKNKQIYIEYLNKMEEFNNELSLSSKMINDYIEEKV